MGGDQLLSTTGLTKIYPSGGGVNGIDIEVNRGEIVGFIGPNGAGKSTTMEIIMGFISAQKGSVSLFGQEIVSEADRLRHINNIGFVPAEKGLYEELKPTELFEFAARLSGTDSKDYAEKLAKQLDLDVNKQISKLSLGNKRKVAVIQALINEPELLILDEPTSGLDPLIQREILNLLDSVRNRGGAVFLSSHALSEVQTICDRIFMIKQGKIILSGGLKEILRQSSKRIEIIGHYPELIKAITDLKLAKKIDAIDGHTLIDTDKVLPIAELLVQHGVEDFYIQQPSLETTFIDYY